MTDQVDAVNDRKIMTTLSKVYHHQFSLMQGRKRIKFYTDRTNGDLSPEQWRQIAKNNFNKVKQSNLQNKRLQRKNQQLKAQVKELSRLSKHPDNNLQAYIKPKDLSKAEKILMVFGMTPEEYLQKIFYCVVTYPGFVQDALHQYETFGKRWQYYRRH